MEIKHQLLVAIHLIVKQDASPLSYLCSPREIILRVPFDWSVIEKILLELEVENYVSIKHFEKPHVIITAAGLAKAKNLQNNFIAADFSLSSKTELLRFGQIDTN